MEIGKLTNEQLNQIIFSKIKYKDKRVLTGAGIGEDCSVVDFRDHLCVISSDPITATNSSIGKLAVYVSCNDIAAKGVKPFGVMLTILAPPSTRLRDIENIMTDVLVTLNELEIELIGGHTEITDAVNRVVLSVTSLGSGSRSALVDRESVQAGDYLLMTKYAGCEGTTILYEDFYEEIKDILSESDVRDLERLKNGLSVIREGLLSAEIGAKLMHDATEGGVLGAAWEMAQKVNLGIDIIEKDVPILPVTDKISKYFGIDALKLISSGVMLIAIGKDKKDQLIETLERENIKVSTIGVFTKENANLIKRDGKIVPISPPEADEIYKPYKGVRQ